MIGAVALTLKEALAAQQVLLEHDLVGMVEFLQDVDLAGQQMRLALRVRHKCPVTRQDLYYYVAACVMADAPYTVFFHEHAFYRCSLKNLPVVADELVRQATRTAGDGYKYALG